MIQPSERSILLIVPPFQTVVRPALGVSQLKANLQEQAFCSKILYLNFRFAEMIGLDLYEWISSYTFNSLLGEFIFSDVLFHRSDDELEYYENRIVRGSDIEDYLTQAFPHESISQTLRRLMHMASGFCDDVVENICTDNHWLIGLTSSFQQNCASLALIRRVKQRRPDILSSMGGANCQSEMGEELFRQFPEIDYIAQGESDHSFINLVRSLQNGNNPTDLAGILTRVNGQHPPATSPLQSEDLNGLPYPDFSDYFDQLGSTSFTDRIAPGLVMETSRGCWWGAKQPCTFCGLNGEERGFRSKSPSRALDEMTTLVNQYGVRDIWMADNILDMKYFRTLLPQLADHPVADIFYETKANLSRSQTELLARSQISWIQPGIESLSDKALRLMQKGTTMIQNIQLLKWCAEYGIWVGWNYLYGFPDEQSEEVGGVAKDIESIHHLQPPDKISSIRMDRFSTYFNDPARYGLDPVSPAKPYHHIYPFPDESLKRIAYFYQSNFFESMRKTSVFKTLERSIKSWQTAYQNSFLLAVYRKNSLIIIDTRSCARRFWHRLSGMDRRVYNYCDKAHTVEQIVTALGPTGNNEVETILDSFVRARLMIHSDRRYLSLAVNSRLNCGKTVRAASGGFVKPVGSSEKALQNLLRIVTLRVSPGKVLAAASRRASGAKTRAFQKTIFHLTNVLSEPRPDEPADSRGPAE